MSTVNGMPTFKDPPEDVIRAARLVQDWGLANFGYSKDWSIYGLQPVGAHSVTRLALNALWSLASSGMRGQDVAAMQRLAQMNAELVEREMKGEDFEADGDCDDK